ncbi:MAG TPA: Calx-beta domain-containing protein [Pyrinomonadaceae bacterium]|nr:Calx-beta domain-containing protein [Pyrinomonadaceae bacterium]
MPTPRSTRPARRLATFAFALALFGAAASAFLYVRARAATTYRWTGSGSWSAATNWTPSRTSPAADDVLVFDGGGSVTVTGVPTQTIGQLQVSNDTAVTLQANPPGVSLTLGGGAGTDLTVDSGSQLNVNQAETLSINLPTGTTGSVGGSMTFSQAQHRLLAADAGAVTFQSGSTFTAVSGFGGNAFGSTNLNSVVFAGGSKYVNLAGGNPFGASSPNSVVVFQAGSTFSQQGGNSPSFSGRTYANVEVTGGNVSVSGGSAVVMDNLTVTGGTLNWGMTGTPGHTIKGNITVTGGTLNFNPSSAGTVNLGGAVAQSVSNSAALNFGANQTLNVNNPNGVTLGSNVTMANGALSLTSGTLSTGANTLSLGSGVVVTRASGYVVGNLKKTYAAAGPKTFEVGTADGYSPVTVNATAGTGDFTVSAAQGKLPQITGANALARYWTLASSGIAAADLTFNYLASDVTGSVGSYVFIKNSAGTLSALAPASAPTSTSASINGVSSFSDWTLAESPSAFGSIQLSSATYSDGETNADHTFSAAVTRTGGSGGNVSVDYAVTAGTATGLGLDYTASPSTGTLTWTSGDTAPKSVSITVRGDLLPEPDETVNFAISNPQGGASLGSPGSSVLTITNDDSVAVKYRSKQTGDWDSASTWEYSADGNTWLPAVTTPTSSDDTVNVRGAHIVGVTAAVSADQLTVESGGILSVAGGVTFTLDDGAGDDLTVEGGGIFAAAGTVNNNGQARIDGTLRVDDGGFPGGGAGTYAYDQTTGVLFFNHTAGTYGVNDFNFWPASNGPQNVSVGTAHLQLNVARTVGLSFETSAGIFGANNLTVGAGGTFTLFTGGFVSGSPAYGAGSTLRYSTGGTYNRSGEWLPDATGGAGYPSNVELFANTTLNLPNGSTGSTFQAGGSLTIGSGSTLDMGAMSKALTALGNVQIDGTLKLSTALGGDLKLQGNLSKSGTFTHNNRAVFFEGGATQSIKDSGGAFTIPYVVVNKTDNTVVLDETDLTTLGPAGGASINFVGGTSNLTLNGRKLTLGGSIGNTPAGSGFVGDASADVSLEDGGSAGSMGTLTFVSGGESLRNLTVNRTGPVGSVILGSNLTVGGTLTLTAGKVLTGSNTLTVGDAGTAARASGYVVGTLRKNFSAAVGEDFSFPVGTDDGYSPVNAESTTGTGSLSVKATQTKHPGIPGADVLARYWTLSGSGITTDLTFNYLDGDVAGDENSYQVFKYDGAFTAPGDQSVSPPDNSATVSGVSSFSDWTLAEFSSVFVPISGTKTVCASDCDYVNLTGAAGLFAAVNSSIVEGNLVAQIAGDLVEDGTHALNQWTESGAGGYTLTIEPADGTMKTISGDVAAGMIRLDGADRVTIDGRFNGEGRSLTFRNTSTAGATIKLSNDASNNTVRSSVVEGRAFDAAAAVNPTVAVVTIGAGATTGNDGNTITDNQIRDRSDAAGVPTTLVLSVGTSETVSNSNGTVSDNELFNFRVSGVHVSSSNDGNDSWTVTGNNVYQTTASTDDVYGLWVGACGTSAVTGNTVHDLSSGDGGVSVHGIRLDPISGTTDVSRNRVYSLTHAENNSEIAGIAARPGGTATVNIFNNQVSLVPSNTMSQRIRGISEQGPAGTSVNLFYNTVLVGGTASGSRTTAACLRVDDSSAASTWRDNICFNNRTGGGANHYAAGNESADGSFSSDYNIFVGTGAGAASDFMETPPAGGPTDDTGEPVSFATWQSQTGGDAHSQGANPGGDYTVANMFTSETDLHLNTAGTNPASNAGTPLGSVTDDYDEEARDTVIPDIGADEVLSTVLLSLSSATYSVGEGGGSVNVVVKRTGSSVGDVAVMYATSDGTAEDGSDYTAASDVLTWPDGDVSDRSFNVDISGDGDDEPDETFNVALSLPAGASLGTPDTAVVTITDDDAPPVFFSIDDVTKAEGNTGTTAFVFTVTKMGAGAASVDFETEDDASFYAAEAGSDYASNSGTLNFDSADTTKTVTVLVNGDTTPEVDETFLVKLSNASGASIGDDTGVGTIRNDEESVGAGQLIISEFRLRGPGLSPEESSPGRPAAQSSRSRPALPKSSSPLSPCGKSSKSATTSAGAGVRRKVPVDVLADPAAAEPDTSPEANDEFIELYNNSDSPLLVTTTDGSEGWAVAASDGIVRFIVPQGTVIPPRAHFLSPNLLGYSLYFYPAGDGGFGLPFAFGDYVLRGDGTDCFGYELDIPDNVGIALFRTSNPSNFSEETRLDAVGPTAETNALYREGAGYPALTPDDISKNLEHSFFRSLCSFGVAACTTPGLPKDTGDNAADFLFVDTEFTATAAGQKLGAPGPENLFSPVQRNAQLSLPLLDRTLSNAAPPNRVRSLTSDPANNSLFGTLEIRRRVTNRTGRPVTALRFRIIELTTAAATPNGADLRARDAADVTVLGVSDEETCSSSGAGPAPCDVTAEGTILEQPSFDEPGQPNGGGLNSSLAVGSITFDDPLEDGDSVNVNFLLGVQKTGAFRFLLNIEAVTDECSCPTTTRPAARPAARR